MSSTDRRELVLDAAVELIARDGFEGVRIADVARQAGVSTALVHYHFANRAQLLTEALTHSLSRAEQRLARTTAAAERTGAPQRLADLIDFALPVTEDDVRESRLWAELESRAAASQELAGALAQLNQRTQQPVADAVAAGLAEGVFHDCEPTEVATVAQALLAGLSVRLTAHDPGLDLPTVRDLAGRHLARTVGYAGRLPFRPLPATLPATPREVPQQPREESPSGAAQVTGVTRRRRAARRHG